MPTTKPTKPSITLPSAFGTSVSNVKTEFTAQELIDGYSASIQQVLDGGNVNWLNDMLFKYLTYTTAICDWLNGVGASKVPFINSSNQLDEVTPVIASADNTFSGTNTFSVAIVGDITGNAATATKATQDGSGNTITSTYMKKDASNASSDGKQTIVGWDAPKNGSAVSVTTTINGTYTCPKDGYLYLACYGNTSSAFLAYQSSLATYRTNVYCCFVPSSNSGVQTNMFRVRKGEVLTCTASTGYSRQATFIPCEGG